MRRTSLQRRILSLVLPFFALASFLVGSAALAQEEGSPEDSEVMKIESGDDEACLGCHAAEIDGGTKMVKLESLKKSPHKDANCQTCHTGITGVPHSKAMTEQKPACGDCHNEEHELFVKSTHANPDMVPGDHPTCTSCHSHGDPHAIVFVKEWSRADKRFCVDCHNDQERMKRYKVDTDAVRSYEESFHGKALLRFGMEDAAICSDCHGTHAVLSPVDPRSATHRNNGAKLCSSQDCHPGASVNFAMSGANHVRLKVKEDVVLSGINWFFRGLVLFTILGMLAMVGLDLKFKILSPHQNPRSGRPAALLIAISFICILATLGLATFEQYEKAALAFGFAAGMLVLAFLVYLVTPRTTRAQNTGKMIRRFSIKQGIQHWMLASSFLALVLTGMPQRFYQLDWLQAVYSVIGGFENARLIHRAAALLMIGVFVWHILDLLVMWKRAGFKMKSWTMIPNKKDAQDLAQMMRVYFGKSKDEPKFDRFAYKQKLDYLAEYWGIPLMVITGLFLWFPLYWGNLLPEVALSAAIVAHGWEATLAFLAIITWHIYNEFLNPDAFPSSKLWLTGTLSREDMLHEHPLELERIEAAEREAAKDSTTGQGGTPAPQAE